MAQASNALAVRSGGMTSTIGEVLPTAARRFGDRTALLVGDSSFSCDDLEALSNSAANRLVADGVQPGDRVALYGPNCWQWLVAYYGIAKTGAVVIPVNVMLTRGEVRYVVENSGARAVVASPERGESLLDLGRAVLLWGDDATDWLSPGAPEFAAVHRDGGDLAAICYTSG